MKKIFLLLFFILINIFFLREECFYDDFFFVEKEYRLQKQEERVNDKRESDYFFGIFEKGIIFIAVAIVIFDCYRLYKVYRC